MKLYIFDVDGVLCDAGCKIDPEFKDWFLNWTTDNKYILVTGGEYSSTVEQVGEEIVNKAHQTFHCMGNQIYLEGREFLINQFDFNEPESEFLSSYTNKYNGSSGNITIRKGSVNFSFLNNATVEEKKLYAEWDKINNERIKFIKDFATMFPQYEAFIGGNASIDICLTGANKRTSFNYIARNHFTEYEFFGDKCFEYGIDYPLYRAMSMSHRITNGYKQTFEILQNDIHST
jgi:hydroxymethylpyrimidine pyrophosphatase-like HAD family hydrolase